MVWRSAICFLALGILLTACNPSGGPKKITETRTIPPAAAVAPATPAPSEMQGMSPGMGMQAMGGMGGMQAVPSTNYTWTAPEGWETVPATPMRKANFKIAADTECYLTVLTGQAGGVQMNVERWRAQMGLGDATMKPEEVAALPKVLMAGKEGVLAEITGTFVSMKGDSKPNHMLLGAIAEMGGESVFVKMVGPEATVKANRVKFLAFCAGLQGAVSAPTSAPVTAPTTPSTEPAAANPAPDTTSTPVAK